MTDDSLRQHMTRLAVNTPGKGFTEINRDLAGWLREIGAGDGLLTLFIRHTSASLTVQENADPDVLADLADSLDRLAPQNAGYRHCNEGPDDMPAHIKSMLTETQLSIPVEEGRPVLGTWQGVFVLEHRAHPHRRTISLHYLGTADSSLVRTSQ